MMKSRPFPATASKSTPPTSTPSDTTSRLRSGTVARLAGLSAATLRVWEHRYGIVSPPKSAAGQRTYSMDDVQRLRLIKRLTLEGHAIGTVAHLPVDALVKLSAGDRASSTHEQRIVVVGLTLAQKLAGRLRASASPMFGDLAEAEREVARCGATDVLVIQLASLHTPVIERVLALRDALPAQYVVVV